MKKNILIISVLLSFTLLAVYSKTGIGSPPVANTPEIIPIPDGKGYIEIKTKVYDADADGCKLKVEYSTDSLRGPWYKAFLDENNIYADEPPFPDINNSMPYQVGSSSPIITKYGPSTVIFRWDTKSEYNEAPCISTGDISAVRIRVRPNDGSLDGGSGMVDKDFNVDNKLPDPPGDLTYVESKTESVIRLQFGALGYDAHFKEYRIYYSTRNNVTENDHLGMNFTSASQIDINNLQPKTNYYFNSWIYDTSGNRAKAHELGPIMTAGISGLSGAHAYPVPFDASSGHNSITFSNIPDNSVIKIYTISGKIIKTLGNGPDDSAVTWDVLADDGNKTAAGTYIYSIQKDSSLKKGKLVILR